MNDLIQFDAIEARLDQLKSEYQQAKPFPYVVIEDFLTPEALALVHAHMPAPNEENKSSDYVFAKNKFENPSFAGGAQIFQQLREALLGERFARLLSDIYGREVFVDPRFLGGGIHQGGEGSYLDMHADFSRHPANKDWLRELNILLYLNKDYDESYGGHLELQHKETGERGRVAPRENRLVLMLTKGHTLHGYKPINFPKGRYRTSLAAYAYSVDTNYSAVPVRSTQWQPEDAGVAKSLLAKASPTLVKLKTALLGSNTERRAAAADKDQNKN
ncbi:2OG-Fe(II) oxygenase [Roseateles sp.]|uniref:2OG-Fe(II) oxygenase n=1 Tax=Roseateles sp. TaxID=1971397 RepID=UPI0031E15E39